MNKEKYGLSAFTAGNYTRQEDEKSCPSTDLQVSCQSPDVVGSSVQIATSILIMLIPSASLVRQSALSKAAEAQQQPAGEVDAQATTRLPPQINVSVLLHLQLILGC